MPWRSRSPAEPAREREGSLQDINEPYPRHIAGLEQPECSSVGIALPCVNRLDAGELSMKILSRHTALFLERATGCLCLISIAIAVVITTLSALGLIKNTPNQPFWRKTFFVLFLVLFLVSVICACAYAFVRLSQPATIHQIFDAKALLRIQKAERFLRLDVIPSFTLILGIDMVLAIAIWGGGGHNLHGTWLFTAGGTPIGIYFAALLPLGIQRETWRVLLVKANQWADGPYE